MSPIVTWLSHSLSTDSPAYGGGEQMHIESITRIADGDTALYIFSRETNRKTKNRLGSNPMMFPMDRLEAIDIDDMEDFYWAEFLLERKLQHEQ